MKQSLRSINRLGLITVVFSLISISKGFGQYYWEEPNRLGIKAGASMSQMLVGSDLKSSESPALGYQLGVFALFPIRRHFTVQSELLFHRKGTNLTTLKNADPKTGPEYKLRFSYIELPLLASYVSGPLHIGGGGYIGYRIGGSATGFAGSDTTFPVFSVPATTRWDYGLLGDISIRNDVYIIGLRGQYGLSSVASSAANLALIDKAKFFSGSLYIGLMF